MNKEGWQICSLSVLLLVYRHPLSAVYCLLSVLECFSTHRLHLSFAKKGAMLVAKVVAEGL